MRRLICAKSPLVPLHGQDKQKINSESMKTFPVTYYGPGIWVVLLHFSSCNIQKNKKNPTPLLMSAQENVGMSRDKQKQNKQQQQKNLSQSACLNITHSENKCGKIKWLLRRARTDLPLLFRTRKTMSQMRRAMIMISTKQAITIPATSPSFRHVAETENLASEGTN